MVEMLVHSKWPVTPSVMMKRLPPKACTRKRCVLVVPIAAEKNE